MMSFLIVNKQTKNVCLLQWYWELPHFLGIQNDFDSFNMGTHWNSNFALSSQWLGLGTAYFIAFSPFHWNMYGHASQNAEFFSSLSLCRPSRPSFFVGCKLSLQRSLRLDFYCMGPKCNVIFQIPVSKAGFIKWKNVLLPFFLQLTQGQAGRDWAAVTAVI